SRGWLPIHARHFHGEQACIMWGRPMVTSYNKPTLFVDDDIELQVLQPRHASALLGLIQANRRHLKRFLEPVDDICSISDVLEYIQDGLESYEEDRAMAQFGIFYCG